jgi:phosphoserine phosphatase
MDSPTLSGVQTRRPVNDNRVDDDSPLFEEYVTATQAPIRTWSAKEFEELVLQCKPRVAVFDCDGTIWSGDAGSGFMIWTMEQGLVSRSTADWIDTRHRAYHAGHVTELQICGEMVQMYSGLHEAELRSAAARYVAEFVHPRVFPEIASLLTTLHNKGVELWAVSSTNKWVVSEAVRSLGIPDIRVLAAEVAVKNGIIGSEIVDIPTDEAKAVALRRVGLSRPDVVFGNSIHDLAMLEIAATPFPVNPSPALLEAAARNGWGYFRPASVEGEATPVGGE